MILAFHDNCLEPKITKCEDPLYSIVENKTYDSILSHCLDILELVHFLENAKVDKMRYTTCYFYEWVCCYKTRSSELKGL